MKYNIALDQLAFPGNITNASFQSLERYSAPHDTTYYDQVLQIITSSYIHAYH